MDFTETELRYLLLAAADHCVFVCEELARMWAIVEMDDEPPKEAVKEAREIITDIEFGIGLQIRLWLLLPNDKEKEEALKQSELTAKGVKEFKGLVKGIRASRREQKARSN